MALSPHLFMQGDYLYAYSFRMVYRYNLEPHHWNTVFAVPITTRTQINSFQLTEDSLVVELETGDNFFPNELIQLNLKGTQIGLTYDLPLGALYETGTNGKAVIFDGDM